MSTHIKTIIGEKDSSDFNFHDETVIPTEMHLTRFWGGASNGRMLQLTMDSSEGYIQLTKSQVKELIEVLSNSFNDEIYPSE